MNAFHINSTHLLDFNYYKTKINYVIYLKIKVLTLTAFESILMLVIKMRSCLIKLKS